MKIKLKSYNGKINTDFHDSEMPKDDSCCMFLDSVFKMGKKHYPQAYLEDSKYIVKVRKMKRYLKAIMSY